MSDEEQQRVVRVFVSSTFRDMQLEREELVKRVFPQVRRLCQSRDVAWSEVDLRWGVTDEQKAEGAVLPICLAEIERSRPYFIGLLGERYGWVPDEIPADEAARLGWLADAGGRSVTELEILHGVLNDPEAAGHAFFYLRDPAWVDTLTPEQRPDFVDDAPDARSKLENLKARIRSSGFPVQDYPDPVALGALVLADLTALVERLYPADEVPDPVAREDAAHDAFAAARFAGHVARPALVARLDEHAAGDGLPLVVTGEPGAGASSLAATWAESWLEGHPEDLVLTHHVGATSASADWSALVERLVTALDRAAGREPPLLPDDAVGRRSAMAAALTRAAADGRRIVLVLDGVDQLDDVDGARELVWLPATPPPGVRIVLTAPQGRSVDAARHRGWAVLEVTPLDADERRDLAVAFLARFAKALDAVHLDRLAGALGTGNALYLRVVLDELRQHGDHFTLGELLDRLLAAATVDDLLELVFARYERDYERDRPGLVGDAFRAVWAARRGLTESELLDVLGAGDDPLPRAVWSPLFLAAEEGLVTRSGHLGFATEHHRKAVEDRYLPAESDRAAVHGRLAAYFAAQPLGPRTVDELPWHQLGAGDHAGLAATLGDLAFMDLAYRRSFRDLRRVWTRAEAAGIGMVDAYRAVVADPEAHPDHAWQVARLLTDAGHPAEAARLHRFLVDQARGDTTGPKGDATLRAALINHGSALWLSGDLEEAAVPLAEAVERCRAAGDDTMLQAAVGNLAMVRRDQGDLDAAETLFAEDERISRALGDPNGLQITLGNRAQLLRMRGDTDGAMALMKEQEQLCRDVGDLVGVARAQAGQAVVLSDRGDLAGSLPLLQAQETTCRDLGDLRGLAESLLNQAVTRTQLGDVAAAAAAAGEGEGIARRLGDLSLVARFLVARGQALVATGGPWPDAERVAREAELAAREVGAGAQVALALGIIGVARREQGDLEGAAVVHRQEQEAAAAVGDPGAVAVAVTNLGAVDIASGRLQEALARYAEAEPVFRRLGTVTNLLPLLTNRGQVKAHLGDVDGALADLAEGARLSKEIGLTSQQHRMLTLQVELLYSSGRAATAEPVWVELAGACRAVGDDAGLQRALGERALLLIGRGDLASAGPLLDEQESICRRIGDQVGLSAALGNRAIVQRQHGDLDGALRSLDEQLTVARASGNGQGVLMATANRGDVLAAAGRKGEALAALEEARTMAQGWGLTPMVAQLDQMIAAVRAG